MKDKIKEKYDNLFKAVKFVHSPYSTKEEVFGWFFSDVIPGILKELEPKVASEIFWDKAKDIYNIEKNA